MLFTINNVFSQDTTYLSICAGDSITLYGVPGSGACDYNVPVYWFTGLLHPYNGYNIQNYQDYFSCSPCNAVKVAPTESAIFIGHAQSLECNPNFEVCGVGTPQWWASLQGNNGGVPPPTGATGVQPVYQPASTVYYYIEVENCGAGQVSTEGCSIPYTGTIKYNYCNGEQFFFIEMEDGTILDPYFEDGIDFDYYQGQLVNFNYEIADFESPCGSSIPAIIVTCIEEHPDSTPIGVDMGVTKITAPTETQGGITQVEVKLTNFGSEPVNSITINWEVNGQLQVPYTFNGLFNPGITGVFSVGSYSFNSAQNHIVKAWTSNANNNGPDVNPANDATARAYINDGKSENVYVVCQGESLDIELPAINTPSNCYDDCPSGNCISCSNDMIAGNFSNCVSNCNAITINPEYSQFYSFRAHCESNISGDCYEEFNDFFVVVTDCSEKDNPNADCDFSNIGTIRFEECGGTNYYLIDQSDGSSIDPYFAYGVDFNYYNGQIVAYDYEPSAFISCTNATPVTVTCIEEVDVNSSSDAGVAKIIQPFFAPEGIASVIINLKNHGTSPLETAVVNWTINGEEQEPYYYSSALLNQPAIEPGDSTFVTIGTRDFEPIDYFITAHTSKPNGVPDPDPYNDLATASLQRGYTAPDILHWGTFAVQPENIADGISTYISLPSQADGCSIPTTPQVSPNTNWALNSDNLFNFTPTENTTYTITYAGNCETYVYTVSVYIGEIPPTYAFTLCQGDTAIFPIPQVLDANGNPYNCDDGVLTGNSNFAHMDDENIYFYPSNQSIFDFNIAESATCPGLENIFNISVADCTPTPTGCGPLTGTIFFEPCNNDIYYFIEMADGTILDPYNGTGINYPYDVEGVQVNFDYIDAAFTSPCNGATAVIITCIEEIEPTANVDFKILLEGPFDENLGLMKTDLLTQNLLPTQQPFNSSPYDYNGTETVSNFPTNTVDWVLVEARAGTPNTGSGNPGTIMIEAKAGLLLSDGSIVDPETFGSLIFENPVFGQSYHFIVRHRNHLDVMTSVKLTIGQNVSYDFTTSGAQTLGTEQTRQLSNGKYAMFAGDFNKDGVIQTTDFDRWYLNPAALSQYINVDANLDGISQISDRDAWYNNRSKLGVADVRQ